MNVIELAAHVDNDVTHSASSARVILGLTGAAIGIAIALTATSVGVIPVIAAAGAYGSAAMDIGKIIDAYRAPSVAGKIVTGFPTVLLGREAKPAARADHPDTTANCDGTQVAEGSKIVMLGFEAKPMARRQDRLKCGGKIADGERTIFVGGDPSMLGIPIEEQDRMAVRVLSAIFGIASAIKSFGKGTAIDSLRGAGKLTAVGLEAAGYKDAANVVKATTATPPKFAPRDLIDSYGTGKNVIRGGLSAGEGGVAAGRAIIGH